MENNTSKTEFIDSLLNRLSLRTVPCIPKLNYIAKGGNSAAIMAELEYEFGKHPQGFFMFYEPQPKNPNHKDGESWAEKVCLDVSTIKLNFDRIGVRYNSLKEFEEAEDKFSGKYYCSIYNSEQEGAFYLRNNPVVNEAVRSVLGDETVSQIYERCNRDSENKRQRIIKDFEAGKIREPLSKREIFELCNTFSYSDEF